MAEFKLETVAVGQLKQMSAAGEPIWRRTMIIDFRTTGVLD